MKTPPTFPSCLETLEPRLAPAGTVLLTISGGVLNITGDGEANGIQIDDDPMNNRWIISDALAGTSFKLNGADQAGPFFVERLQGIKANLNGGNDRIELNPDSTNSGMVLDKGVVINGGDGNDQVLLGTTSAQSFIFKSLQVNLGNGDDAFDMTASVMVYGPAKLTAGAGADDIRLEGVSALQTFQKGLSVDLGSGSDDLRFASESFSVQGSLIVKGAGDSADSSSIFLNSTYFSVSGAASFSIQAGQGNYRIGNGASDIQNFGGSLKITGSTTGVDDIEFEGSTQVAGALTIDVKGGDNETAVIAGSTLRAASLSLKGGTGNDTFILEDGSSLDVSGAFKAILGSGSNYVTGLAGSEFSSGTYLQTGLADADGLVFNGDRFAVRAGITLGMGDGDNQTNLAATLSTAIGGSLKYTGLHGTDNLVSSSPVFSLQGSLQFKAGNGTNNLVFSGAESRIGGTLAFAGGTGTDTLLSNGSEFFVNKQLSFNGSSGDNTFYIASVNAEVGSVKYAGGTGADVVALGDTDAVTTDRLAIHGQLLVNLGAGSSVMYLTDTIVQGAMNVRSQSGSADSDQLQVVQSQFNSNVSILQGAGTSFTGFTDITARASVLYNSGEGAAEVYVDNGAGSNAFSRWFGTTRFITGSSDDTIIIGSSPAVAFAGNIFFGNLIVDDGSGTDSFAQGNNSFLGGSTLP